MPEKAPGLLEVAEVGQASGKTPDAGAGPTAVSLEEHTIGCPMSQSGLALLAH